MFIRNEDKTAIVFRPGVYVGPNGERIDTSKIQLPAMLPVKDSSGNVIGTAEIAPDGMATMRIDKDAAE